MGTALAFCFVLFFGCYSINYDGLSGLSNKHLFLTVLKAGKSKIKAMIDSVSSKAPFPSSQVAVFSHHGSRVAAGSLLSLIRALTAS